MVTCQLTEGEGKGTKKRDTSPPFAFFQFEKFTRDLKGDNCCGRIIIIRGKKNVAYRAKRSEKSDIQGTKTDAPARSSSHQQTTTRSSSSHIVSQRWSPRLTSRLKSSSLLTIALNR